MIRSELLQLRTESDTIQLVESTYLSDCEAGSLHLTGLLILM
jgi:hypothetical protein